MSYKHRLALLCAVFSGTQGHAQLFPSPQDRMFWKERSVVRFEFKGTNIIEEFLGDPIKEKRYGLIGDLSEIHYLNGSFFGTKKFRKDAKPRIDLYSSADGTTWSLDATCITTSKDQSDVSRVISIGSDRYLLMAGFVPFRMANSESYLALGRKGTNCQEIHFDKLIDFDFPSNDHQAIKQAVGPIFNPILCFGTETITLALPRVGLLWSFSTRGNGTIKLRSRAIYKDVWESVRQGVLVENAILGIQPTSDGSLMIASRSRDGAINGLKASEAFAPERQVHATTIRADQHKSPHMALEAFTKAHSEESSRPAFSEAKDLSVKAYPEIKWWEYDPDTNKLREVHPPGAKTLLTSASDVQNFRFRIRVDGKVIVHGSK